MSDKPIFKKASTPAYGGKVSPGDLVALDGSVYRILAYQGKSELFVEAENIETFERVSLTTAVIPASSANSSTAMKRHRVRNRR